MTDSPNDIDVDAPIRARIFQPLVDALHLDPVKAAWDLFVVHTACMVVAVPALYLSVAMLHRGRSAPEETSAAVMGSVVLVLLCVMFARRLRRPPWLLMNPAGAVLRASYALITVMSVPVMLNTTPGPAHAPERIAGLALVIGFAVGTVAGYVHVCRRPPPRKPGTARRPAFAG